jgi:4-hydroxy-tetrahydrodipicolinate synthase
MGAIIMDKLNTGVWPTMITPYTEDNQIDWEKLDKLIDWYIASGVSGLFAVCLSSEIFHLTEIERLKLADYIVKRVNGRIQIVSGILLSDNTSESIKHIFDTGVNAVVFLAGQLFLQTEDNEASFHKIEKILSNTDNIPLGIYESPLPYHKILSASELKKLVFSNRFYFMKDTSCDINIIEQKLEVSKNTNCSFFNANTPTLLDSLKLGASGYSGIAANFYPELYVWLCKNHKKENKLAEELSDFLRIIDPLIHTKYPVSAKVYQKINGINIAPISRSSDHKLINAEISSLESLNRIINNWHHKLNIEI